MAITAENTGTTRELVPAGNYVARCYSMVEIGTVKELYMGVEKMLHKVRITWELPFELKVFDEKKGEQPLSVSKEYTLSMYEKANLRKELESWRGKAFTEEEAKKFDITALIGKPCMINLIHKPSEKDPSKVYERISAISPLAKGTTCPDQINPSFILSFDEWDEEKFQSLPDFLKEKIKASNQFAALHIDDSAKKGNVTTESEGDDLPF